MTFGPAPLLRLPVAAAALALHAAMAWVLWHAAPLAQQAGERLLAPPWSVAVAPQVVTVALRPPEAPAAPTPARAVRKPAAPAAAALPAVSPAEVPRLTPHPAVDLAPLARPAPPPPVEPARSHLPAELQAPEVPAAVLPAPTTPAVPPPAVAGPAATEAPAAVTARPATAAPHPAVEVARADHRHCPAASHPRALRERGIEGAVRLAVRISAEGVPADVRVVEGSGWRLFDEAALAQARGCRFVPARRDGVAVESWVQFRVRFALAGPADGFAPLALTQPERERP